MEETLPAVRFSLILPIASKPLILADAEWTYYVRLRDTAVALRVARKIVLHHLVPNHVVFTLRPIRACRGA